MISPSSKTRSKSVSDHGAHEDDQSLVEDAPYW